MIAVDVGPRDGAEIVALGAAEEVLVAAEDLDHAEEGLEAGRGQDDDDQDLGPAAGADRAQDEVAEEAVAEDEDELGEGGRGDEREGQAGGRRG